MLLLLLLPRAGLRGAAARLLAAAAAATGRVAIGGRAARMARSCFLLSHMERQPTLLAA